jgi:hypothetical protein
MTVQAGTRTPVIASAARQSPESGSGLQVLSLMRLPRHYVPRNDGCFCLNKQYQESGWTTKLESRWR